MTIMTTAQINDWLKTIAFEEADIQGAKPKYLPELYAKKKRIEHELAILKDTIKIYESGQDLQLRDSLKADFDAHLQAGGDPKVHERVEVRRNKKWMYDQKAALAWAQEHGIRDVIRVKETLDKRAMDKMVKEGHYPDAEEVHSVSIVLPSVLGDLLITDTD